MFAWGIFRRHWVSRVADGRWARGPLREREREILNAMKRRSKRSRDSNKFKLCGLEVLALGCFPGSGFCSFPDSKISKELRWLSKSFISIFPWFVGFIRLESSMKEWQAQSDKGVMVSYLDKLVLGAFIYSQSPRSSGE